jgi:hypothetical protein
VRIDIRPGKGGRYRWFAVTDSGRIAYSSFPNSFPYEQLAWEDAEWAVGAAVYMTFKPDDPDEGFTNYAASRTFDSL